MRHWIATFVAALLIVIGCAAGVAAVVILIVAFLTSLFLLWAHELGFYGAWTRFGLDRFVEPFFDSKHRQLFMPIFSKAEVLRKACTIAVASVAILLCLPASEFLGAVLLVAGFAILEIHHANKLAPAPLQALNPTTKLCFTNATITSVGIRRAKFRPILVSGSGRMS
jgi:hypothetical protein